MDIEYKHRDGMHVDVLIVNNKKDGAIQKHKLPILSKATNDDGFCYESILKYLYQNI